MFKVIYTNYNSISKYLANQFHHDQNYCTLGQFLKHDLMNLTMHLYNKTTYTLKCSQK